MEKLLASSDPHPPKNIKKTQIHKNVKKPLSFSLKSLKRSPGLPYYTPREPKIVEMTSNSARLRKQHGRRERFIHDNHPDKRVKVAKNGVQALDIRRWVDNVDRIKSPRIYFQYTQRQRPRWCNT